MLKRFFFLALVAATFVTCKSGADAGAEGMAQEKQTRTADVAADVAGEFGDAFEAAEVLPAAELTTRYDDGALVDTVHTTLRGTVNEVCQAKGCWMTIATADDEEIMVKFKDYGFFMPKDISGREVVMNGMAYYQVTPVDELRHYAEDAGKTPEEVAAITEPQRELRFLADGVRLLVD